MHEYMEALEVQAVVHEAFTGGEWYKIDGGGTIFHDLVQPTPLAE